MSKSQNMQVIFHAGVHCTDEDALVKTLRRNVDMLRKEGVIVPGPGRYRKVLSEILTSLSGAPASPDARDVMVEHLIDEDEHDTSRLLMSHPNFFSVPKLLFGGGRYYRHAEARVRNLCELFQGDEVHLHLGLRDPATFLPAVYENTPHTSFSDFMNGVDPMHLRWSHFLQRLRDEMPHMPITVWCNEDTPLIWSEIVCRVAGLPLRTPIVGSYDIYSKIIAPEGMRRFRDFLKENPDMSFEQERRVMLAFLDKYALRNEIEQELDLPGWDQPYVERLSEIYDEDMGVVAKIPGVTFIEP